ncbi:MAG: J domain-containing protein [Halobellus sp.]|uniref:J domain-containing protein n=1 Tax=Halobellus sp. TaxID=1979212 RepID=UPI0035D424BF
MEDFYELLGVSEDASPEEIDRAWRERVRRYHPDVNDDARATAQFKTLKAAHEVLSEEKKRAAYDRMGHETYVRERLGGLPTAGQPGPDAADDKAEDGEATRGVDRSSTDRQRTTRTGGSRTGRSSGSHSQSSRSSTSRGRTTSDRTQPSSRTNTNGQTTSGSRQTESRNRAGGQSGNTRSDRSDRSSRRAQSTTDNGRSTADAGTGRETVAAERTGLSRLQYAWITVVLAGAVYIAGLWQYLAANAGVLATLRTALVTDPNSALTAVGTLMPPGTFALRAVSGAASTTLLFPTGAVVLAVTFVAVVVAVGRGSAYLYVFAGLAPLVGLAIGPLTILPTGAVLALVVVLPVGGTVLFALDAGRYVT